MPGDDFTCESGYLLDWTKLESDLTNNKINADLAPLITEMPMLFVSCGTVPLVSSSVSVADVCSQVKF